MQYAFYVAHKLQKINFKLCFVELYISHVNLLSPSSNLHQDDGKVLFKKYGEQFW